MIRGLHLSGLLVLVSTVVSSVSAQFNEEQPEVSPAAGAPFTWELGRQVSTYSSINLYNGNLLTQIPITSWPTVAPDFEFRLFHNSSAATGGIPADPGSGFSLGQGWSISFGGQLVFIQENGQTVEIIVVEDNGLLKSYTPAFGGGWTPPTGVHDTLEYDATNDEWVLTRKNQWRRIYDASGRLVRRTNSYREINLSNEVNYTAGRIRKILSNVGCHWLDFQYDAGELQMLWEVGVVGRAWWFEYDQDDRLETLSGPYQESDGGENGEPPANTPTITFAYDYTGRITSITDREGNTFVYNYDGFGRPDEIVDPAPYQTQTQAFVYSELSSPPRYQTAYTDRRGMAWIYIFEDWGGLERIVNPLADFTRFEYDNDYNRTSLFDEDANEWVSTYDSVGNRISLTDPLGQTWEWTYDSYNNLTSVTPPLDNQGNVNDLKRVEIEYLDYYDMQQQLIADYTHATSVMEPPDGQGNPLATTLLEYYHLDDEGGGGCCYKRIGTLKSVTDANDVQTLFYYWGATGRPTSWVEGRDGPGDGPGTYYPVTGSSSPDAAGRIEQFDVYNGKGEATYDDNNNPKTSECITCEGWICPLGGGPVNPPSEHVPVDDCAVHIGMPRCDCASLDPMFTYDKMGNLLTSEKEIEAVHRIINWGTYPAENSFEAEYSSREKTIEYDELNRIRETTIESTEPAWNAFGGPVATIRTYNTDYNENGDLSVMTDADGTVNDYDYDDAGRLTEVDVNGAMVVLYTLYANGRIHFADYLNGVQTEYTYDDAQRLDVITVTDTTTPVMLHSLDYDWTPDGLVSSIGVVEGPDSYTVNFSYDLRSRLIREWSSDGPASRDYDLSYTYDQVGNRLTKTDNLSEPDIVTTYTYDVHDPTPAATYGSFNNRLMSHKVEQDATVLEETWYAYNFGGQIRRIVSEYPQTQEDYYFVRVLQYNINQQLWLIRGYEINTIETDCDDVTATFAREFRYANDRARYAVIDRDPGDLEPTGSTWHDYVSDNIYKDLTIDSQTGVASVTASYAFGYSLASMADASGRTYFHGDMLGTTRLISDGVAAPVVSPAFTAFGQPLPLAAAGGPVSQPNLGTRYGYAGSWGYQNDGAASANRDIGLLHVGARYYNPEIGRFIQRDPIGLAGGMNIYSYVRQVPTIAADPSGLMFNYMSQATAGHVMAVIQQASASFAARGMMLTVAETEYLYRVYRWASLIYFQCNKPIGLN